LCKKYEQTARQGCPINNRGKSQKENLYFNSIKDVKKSVRKARKTDVILRKNGQKAREKGRLYFKSKRWNAGWSVFLTAQKKVINFNFVHAL
jgi:type II secretory pathway component PulC